MLYFTIVACILLQFLIIIGSMHFSLKYFKKEHKTADKIEVKVSGKNITSEVIRDGFKDAIREIAYEDEQEKLIQKKNREAEQVYSSYPKDEPVRKSDGNLIPYGLTESEKEVLEMFYSKD